MDLVSATSPKSREVALHQLDRGLGERIGELRDQIIGLAALLVQHIDFPEEDDAPTPLPDIVAESRVVAEAIERLLATAPSGELLREGALTVLAGRPNSGKSSLFNALIGAERAIVTAEAGTTRDALEATVSVDGFPFRIVDTAGLRDEAGHIEQLGIEVAHRYLKNADLVLYCVESDRLPDADEVAFLESVGVPVILARTKVDAGSGAAVPVALGDAVQEEIGVSAHDGTGLDKLRGAMSALVFRGVVEGRNEVPVVTRARQAGLLRSSLEEVRGFGAALEAGVPPEVASAHLKSAESDLEEILGIVGTEDILDRVFRDFCIGK